MRFRTCFSVENLICAVRTEASRLHRYLKNAFAAAFDAGKDISALCFFDICKLYSIHSHGWSGSHTSSGLWKITREGNTIMLRMHVL